MGDRYFVFWIRLPVCRSIELNKFTHGVFHVGLAGTKPHFTDKDIFKNDYIVSLDCHCLTDSGGPHCIKSYFPLAVGIRYYIFLLTTKSDTNLFTRRSSSP